MERVGHTTKFNASFIVSKKYLKTFLIKGGNISNCQQNIDEQIDRNIEWLTLENVLQNIPGKEIATLVGKIKTTNVVIKMNIKMLKRKSTIWGHITI